MQTTQPTLEDLFAQLGLPNSPAEIDAFVLQHCPLDESLRLKDAPFWTPSQAALIQQKLAEDSDWTMVVDSLSVRLRKHPSAMPQADAGGPTLHAKG